MLLLELVVVDFRMDGLNQDEEDSMNCQMVDVVEGNHLVQILLVEVESVKLLVEIEDEWILVIVEVVAVVLVELVDSQMLVG